MSSLANKLITAAASSQTNYSYLYVGAVSGTTSLHTVSRLFQQTDTSFVNSFNINVQEYTGQWIGVDPINRQLYAASIAAASFGSTTFTPYICVFAPNSSVPYKAVRVPYYLNGYNAVNGPIMVNNNYVAFPTYHYSTKYRYVYFLNKSTLTLNAGFYMVADGTSTYGSGLVTAMSRDGTRLYAVYCNSIDGTAAQKGSYISIYDMTSNPVSAIKFSNGYDYQQVVPSVGLKTESNGFISRIAPHPTDNNVIYFCYTPAAGFSKPSSTYGYISKYIIDANAIISFRPGTTPEYAGTSMIIEPTGTYGYISTWSNALNNNFLRKYNLAAYPSVFYTDITGLSGGIFKRINDIALSRDGNYIYVGTSFTNEITGRVFTLPVSASAFNPSPVELSTPDITMIAPSF